MEESSDYMMLALDEIRNKGWVVGHSYPKDAGRHTIFIQFGYNVVDAAWHDENHLHTSSEEWYFVLRGKLFVEVHGTVITVGPRQILGVKPNVSHRVIGGEGPIEEFSIRAPSVKDKVVLG